MGTLWPPDPTKRASLDLVSPRTWLKVSGHHMRGKISTRHWCWNPSHNLHVQFARPLRVFSKTVHQLRTTVDLDTANTALPKPFNKNTKSRFNHFWTFLLRMSHLNVACTMAHSRNKVSTEHASTSCFIIFEWCEGKLTAARHAGGIIEKNINRGCFAYSRCSTLLKLKSSKFIYNGGFPAPNSPVALRFLTYPNWYSWCARSHVQSFKNETLSDLAMCKSTCRFLCTSLRPYKRPHTVAPEHWSFLYGKDFLQLFKMSASRCRKI